MKVLLFNNLRGVWAVLDEGKLRKPIRLDALLIRLVSTSAHSNLYNINLKLRTMELFIKDNIIPISGMLVFIIGFLFGRMTTNKSFLHRDEAPKVSTNEANGNICDIHGCEDQKYKFGLCKEHYDDHMRI